MGKLKSIIIGAAAICTAILSCSGSIAGQAVRGAVYLTAGINCAEMSESTESAESTTSTSSVESTSPTPFTQSTESTQSTQSDISTSSEPENPPKAVGKVITLNRSTDTDDTDFSQFTTRTGVISRYAFGKSSATNYVTLDGGAQVQNITDVTCETLAEAAKSLPPLGEVENPAEQPQVLIYHTHTTESYCPNSDWYDENCPDRSRDSSRNMTAVGDAICDALSERGIASVHDCTVHDYPMYTGAYYRSADTVESVLAKYPSIKLVLDIHRDGIAAEDGTPIAPAITINGKSAAQFMIISGCDDKGELDLPNYMENFKTACLVQRAAEAAYPGLARAMLFDYRNYNQHISAGSLLIEVGSQANTLDEAVYTGELLGNILADAVEQLIIDN